MEKVDISILSADFLCANEMIVNVAANKLVWPKGMIPLSVAPDDRMVDENRQILVGGFSCKMMQMRSKTQFAENGPGSQSNFQEA